MMDDDFEERSKFKRDGSTSLDPYKQYISDIVGIELLEQTEAIHYSRLAQNSDQNARKIMIESNLRLVVKIAQKYARQKSASYSLLDLIDEGNIGLIKAVDRFDPELGYQFSTYAVWWIRESIQAYVMNHKRTVRLPINIQKKIRKLAKSAEIARNENQRIPSIRELVNREKLSISSLHDLICCDSLLDFPVSADSQKNDQYDLENSPDHLSLNPSSADENTHLIQTLEKLVTDLPSKHKDIIVRRYGLFGHKRETLLEISGTYQLTKERIRQLQKEGLLKLKSKLRYEGWD